jgi:hypothetical protein
MLAAKVPASLPPKSRREALQRLVNEAKGLLSRDSAIAYSSVLGPYQSIIRALLP